MKLNFGAERHHYSMFDVQSVHCSAQLPVAEVYPPGGRPVWSKKETLVYRDYKKAGVESNFGHFAFCRLGWAYLGLCWVSFHSTQPTLSLFDCAMRNPTMAVFRTKPKKRISNIEWILSIYKVGFRYEQSRMHTGFGFFCTTQYGRPFFGFALEK